MTTDGFTNSSATTPYLIYTTYDAGNPVLCVDVRVDASVDNGGVSNYNPPDVKWYITYEPEVILKSCEL